jgi:hypothetical protein
MTSRNFEFLRSNRPELADLAAFAERDAAADAEMQEYAVGVEWKRAYLVSDAKWADGLFANRNIVCRPTHPATIEFLEKHFPKAVANGEEPAS